MSKVLVTESNLMAIGAAIRGRNGTATTYRPGEMAAAIQAVPNRYGASDEGKVVSSGALVAQTSVTKTANGTYDTTTNNEVVVDVAPNLQSKTATENGTVTPDQGYDGLSSVVVDVSGGGSNVIVDTIPPTSDVGTVGQLYIYVGELNAIAYCIKITVAGRGTDYSFRYWGARDIDFVFTDGVNEYHLRDFTSAKAEWAYGANPSFSTQNGLINGNTGSYYENNNLPAWIRVSAEVPSGYTLEKVRICGRNDSSWKDFWRTFEIGQIRNGVNFINTLISEENLVLSDWDTSSQSAYTEFVLPTPAAPVRDHVYTLYQKTQSGWVVVAN